MEFDVCSLKVKYLWEKENILNYCILTFVKWKISKPESAIRHKMVSPLSSWAVEGSQPQDGANPIK